MGRVVELDKAERDKRLGLENIVVSARQPRTQAFSEESQSADSTKTLRPDGKFRGKTPSAQQPLVDSDGEEYEEVEVTDDEEDYTGAHPHKRMKSDDGNGSDNNPVDFNEDDIAFQLAAMGEDYGLDPGEYGENSEGLDEGAEGLPLTLEDSTALFKDMLNDHVVSPYTTWEALLEDGRIIEDDRYTVLPNMRSRREVWGDWSRDKIRQSKEQRAREEKKDPRIAYFALLESKATPKLYWPEFRRKYQKEPEMRNTKLSDKDREKWYRDYVNRLKTSEAVLKADLVSALKNLPLKTLNRASSLESLPSALLTDLRYCSLRASARDPMIKAHIASLPDAPADSGQSPEEEVKRAKERQERSRREQALAERQRAVEEEKRRQRGELHRSKGRLRDEEEEVQRAMKIGKEGLQGHMQEDQL